MHGRTLFFEKFAYDNFYIIANLLESMDFSIALICTWYVANVTDLLAKANEMNIFCVLAIRKNVSRAEIIIENKS